jgi:hypothetical protein
MTEAEWLTATEAKWVNGSHLLKLIDFAAKQGLKRKLRLFACGCARRFVLHLPEGVARVAIVVTEQWVDHEASRREWRTAKRRAELEFRALCNAVNNSAEATEASRLAMWSAKPALTGGASGQLPHIATRR